MRMKTISIFGVTGSIGTSALQILRDHSDGFKLNVISAHSNMDALLQITNEFSPEVICVSTSEQEDILKENFPNIEILTGSEGLVEGASRETDICLNAIVGAAGLPISLAAACNAKTLALANKESLVCAGQLLLSNCQKGGTQIVPVDSEHSAIFQVLEGQDRSAIHKIILTASGGPFRDWSYEKMQDVGLEDALKHPNWDMGARITIDSASMFNKALEMIEAQQLFGVASEDIDVLVHPQSIIHSLVEFTDGGQLAQLGVPDMRHAIAYAIHYPKRGKSGVDRLDLAKIGALDFSAPDEKRFPALRLAREVMNGSGCEGAAFNAAKEIALDGFMAGNIGFLQMADIVEKVMVHGDWKSAPDSLPVIKEADQLARELARNYIN